MRLQIEVVTKMTVFNYQRNLYREHQQLDRKIKSMSRVTFLL